MTWAALMAGRRATGYEDFFADPVGAYWKLEHEDGGPVWVTCPPCGHQAHLADGRDGGPAHEVTEHEDGRITVDPSIVCVTCGWHGYLRAGRWEQI